MTTKTMTTKTIKIPSADHPITIELNPKQVVVSVAGRVIAKTREALTLREASYPAVQYIPLLRDNLDENGSGSRSVKRRPVAKR
jgi:uncharacterized protein (DUF427 family)